MDCRIITCTTIMSERSWMEKECGCVVSTHGGGVLGVLDPWVGGVGSAYSIDRPCSAAWHRGVRFVYH